MKKENKMKVRFILIDSRIRKKKREYYFVVMQYDTSFTYKDPQRFNYPEFKKTFSSKPAARKYAFETVDKMEARYKNIRFVTTALFE